MKHDAATCQKPCRECLRILLDRKPPPGSWRDFYDSQANGVEPVANGEVSSVNSNHGR